MKMNSLFFSLIVVLMSILNVVGQEARITPRITGTGIKDNKKGAEPSNPIKLKVISGSTLNLMLKKSHAVPLLQSVAVNDIDGNPISGVKVDKTSFSKLNTDSSTVVNITFPTTIDLTNLKIQLCLTWDVEGKNGVIVKPKKNTETAVALPFGNVIQPDDCFYILINETRGRKETPKNKD